MNLKMKYILMPCAAVCAMLLSVNVASAQVCGETTWDLWAGQTKNVGSVTVSNDQVNLYITYELDYQDPDCVDQNDIPTEAVEAEFGTLHVWVGESLDSVPSTGGGTPIPGQFPYKYDANGLQTYTFTIPFVELGITDVSSACETSLYVVTHAEVNYLDCDGNLTGGDDTAFGGDNDVNVGEPGRWWYYSVYDVCCDSGEPPVPFCETAFAKGTHVWTTGRKSNPENLPSLELTKNRWGWTINLTEQGDTEYEIWAGAGLNNTEKGVLVGTLMVSWDGEEVSFCYDLDDGFTMQELHVYAGDDSPTTLAPGQYGYTRDFNESPVEDYCGSLPAKDCQGGGVWVVAHAVVCTGG